MSRVWPVLLLAVAAGACVPEAEDLVAFDERFEDCVECRWSTGWGRYALVETVHPTEHGLTLLEPTWMSATLAIEMYDDFNDGHWIEYSTDCGGTPAVYVTGAGLDAWSVEVVLPTAPDGTPGEFERVYANLPPIADPDPYDYAGPRLTSLVLRTDTWSGPCVIDNLRVMLSAPDDGW